MSTSLFGGGFLPSGARYIEERPDQGRDLMTTPGGPILAPGSGYVVRNGSDPGGFGPSYPIVHFNTGPYAGQDIYIGHTFSALAPGTAFGAGTVLSRTGATGNESWNGNASQPGWAEIGFAPGGTPGPFGQPTPFGASGAGAVATPSQPAAAPRSLGEPTFAPPVAPQGQPAAPSVVPAVKPSPLAALSASLLGGNSGGAATNPLHALADTLLAA